LKTKDLIAKFADNPILDVLSNHLNNKHKQIIHLQGILASSASLYFLAFLKKKAGTNLIVLNDKEEASYFYNDLTNLSPNEDFLFFPSSFKRSVQFNQIDSAAIIQRTNVFNKLVSGSRKVTIVTYPEAIIEKVITERELEENTLKFSVGEHLSLEFIKEVLVEYHFKQVDFVFEPGQYSIRGSIIDIFSFSNDNPYRIDFFGNEVESIRTFDIISQLSKAKLEQVIIIPDIQNKNKDKDKDRISFFSFLSKNTVLWLKNARFTKEKLNQIFENIENKKENLSENIQNDVFITAEHLIGGNTFEAETKQFHLIEIGHDKLFATDKKIDFNVSIQPAFSKNFKLLADDLFQKQQDYYQILIFSDSQKQIERLTAVLNSEEINSRVNFEPVLNSIHSGFIDHQLRVCCYTDHQIFERYYKFKTQDDHIAKGKEALSLSELQDLQNGDYVVHTDHGIGRFGGLQTTEINGKRQEAIRLVYKDNDILLVSIHSLHRISKYKGKDAEPPQLYKLGSGTWQKLKARTKSKVKDIAKELIALYAKRKTEKGYAFAGDSYLQQALEASFIYEDTPDQLQATIDVKSDMEKAEPMDRLVCGDVGFGKTEVAIRAAFKAVADSKQVAVLVPTTILALQHFKTFSNRLKDFPATVDYISRLRSSKQISETLKNVSDGKIDILIGTHKILGKEVKFKDLGLLIIDEEQKFGVAMKEKLKEKKLNVDTLTLTATPIPRTLHFSLMGARDLSIIKTPPPNRYPILTELHIFGEEIIREAINYEIERNGQVFFINNRVQNIYEVQSLISRICPDARTVVAHGQMEGAKLEKIMLDFMSEEYDVLIATTIIESGLDIPNANTIIINNAHNFGLSDLHQLRGRVGRSNKKAFCYLLAPPLTTLSAESRRRLQAINNFSELGSGFNIALQDLDIRGAGNMLGAEQSGYIADIGFETYHKILDEALLELRENEFKELFEKTDNNEEEKKKIFSKNIRFVSDCLIETDFELHFPEKYIENVAERVKLYRRLDSIQKENELNDFEKDLTDRFGKIPPQTQGLFEVVRLRWLAIELGIEKIVIKNHKYLCYFVSNRESAYYQSPIFGKVLIFVQEKHHICKMEQKNNKLILTINYIKDIYKARELLGKILTL
jgi:transcription-repair coupling factor (superfamily II helicase)